jgi:voltage-gated potassium channel
VRLPVALLAFAVIYGTAGYMVLERFGFVDAVYMTVTTLTTVGFGEVRPLGTGGRVFTITVIVVGFAGVFTLLTVFTTAVASGKLGRRLTRRTMQQRIEGLHDHYIVCAFGRVGRAAVEELTQQGVGVVVVELDTALEPALVEEGVPYVLDDPTAEEVLEQAGVSRARALLCAVDSDAVNVYITLLARARNPDLYIIARASSTESVEALRRAGATRVVSPYRLSGRRMAGLALHPALLEFADMVSVAPGLRIEELVVGDGSRLAGRTVREVAQPHEGVMILAVRSPDGQLLVPPKADTPVSAGDQLILLGPVGALDQLAGQAD